MTLVVPSDIHSSSGNEKKVTHPPHFMILVTGLLHKKAL